MADEQMVLVNDETGDELVFTSRAEYLAVKYSGGWRDKQASSPSFVEQARPMRSERPRREPVNDNPAVETSPGE